MQNVNKLVVIYGKELMASGDKTQKNGVVHERLYLLLNAHYYTKERKK
jgi:predicted metalloprotease